MEGKTVILHDQNGHSQAFSEEHAARLLAYPGSLWSKKEEAKAPAETAEAKPKK